MGITLAHLKEAVDRLLDRIALVAKTASKSIEEMGKTKADKVNIMSLTIPASGWSSDSTAGCPYYLDIPVSGLTANDCVAVVVAPTCAKTALTAGLTSTESFAGAAAGSSGSASEFCKSGLIRFQETCALCTALNSFAALDDLVASFV